MHTLTKTVDETLSSFQKNMWSDDRPLIYCLQYIEELLREQIRCRTVMLESRKVLESLDDSADHRDLIFALSGDLSLVYLNHLTEPQREEYNQYLKKQVLFDDMQE